mmetsp:Transcript_27/g.104  ORF Transcript_27/g.104 Transcript_27/m.104 type:complete len:153 (+) Transcript_27:2-460(+)
MSRLTHHFRRRPSLSLGWTMLSLRKLLLIALLAALASPIACAPTVDEEEDPDDVPPHSEEEIEDAREEFAAIDVNPADGFITREEVQQMADAPEEEEIEEFFETYDLDQDGQVSFEEIMTADESLRQAGEEEAEHQMDEEAMGDGSEGAEAA